MTGTADPTPVVSDIDAVLARLQALGDRIRQARTALAPLEAGLATARREFDQRMEPLRREGMRLETAIAALRAPAPAEKFTPIFDADLTDERARPATPPPSAGRDVVEKDVLLDHLVRVLDPDTDEQASLLLERMQGLCNDPATGLADVLEELPWGAAWTARQRSEGQDAQLRRLTIWETALRQQLALLEQARERLSDTDPRYRLYQERQRGQRGWETYLDLAAARQQARNSDLRAELDDLRAATADSEESP